MNVVALPVSRLTYKILTHDFGFEPIELHQRHPLFAAVVHAPAIKGRGERYDKMIQFVLPTDTALDLAAAGRNLHVIHIERMMLWTKALHDACMPARTALQRFYNFYDLHDDDYDFTQTAYKAWQRWKDRYDEEHKKSPAKLATFSEMYVLRKSQVSQVPEELPTDAELELRCDTVALRLFEVYPTAPDYLYRQVQIFIWKIEGNRNAGALAALFNLHRANIYKAVSKIYAYAKEYPEFRSIFEERQQTHILPDPPILTPPLPLTINH